MSLLDRMTRAGSRFLSARTSDFFSSAAAGVWLACWIHQMMAGFGTSLPAQTALVLVVLAAVSVGAWLAGSLQRRCSGWPASKLPLLLLALHAAAGVTAATSSLQLHAGWSAIDLLPLASGSASTGLEIVTLAAGIATAWFFPLLVLSLLVLTVLSHRESTCLSSRAGSRIGVAAGSAVVAVCLASGPGGLNISIWLAIALGMLAATVAAAAAAGGVRTCGTSAVSRPTADGADVSGDDLPGDDTASPSDAAQHEAPPLFSDGVPSRRLRSMRPMTGAVLLAFLSGVLFAALNRLSGQLFLSASWLTAVGCASVVFVSLVASRIGKRSALGPLTPVCLAATGAVAIPAAWPLLLDTALELNSSVSSVVLAAMARTGIVSICLAPAGLLIAAAGLLFALSRHREPGPTSEAVFPLRLMTSLTAGWLVARWWAVPDLGIPVIIAGVSLISLAAVFLFANPEPARPLLMLRRPALLTAGAVILAGPVLVQNYAPERSAKLLFDTGVFITSRNAERSEILPFLDEGRCVSMTEGDHGTLTFWKYRGNQLQIRESGLPIARASVDTDVCPQPSAEILQTVLPLVMHSQPRDLLLLGLRSGAALQTSIAFPLESIVCVEPDRGLTRVVSREVLSKNVPNPLDDSRVRLQSTSPLLKLHRESDSLDVIILGQDQLGIPRAAPMATAEFLQAADEALREDGLLCQPLDYVDAGPDALQIVFDTWSSIFADVAAIEIAPGKLLLAATNGSQEVIRNGLVARLRRPNVRFALAQAGWDWSTPLKLNVYTRDGIQSVSGESEATVSTIASSRLTCLLPWEVMRWGDKYNAVMKKFGPAAITLQAAVGKEGYDPAVKTRLKELAEQRTLIHDHPDEYWYYRARIKKRLTKSPRSELVQVKGEEPVHELHEEEKRRLDYFKALGRAAKQKQPGLDVLSTIEEFAWPYDPLVSLFLHQEVAELAARNRKENLRFELRHRLHRIYFSSPADRAVRNIVATIRLICEHPEAIPNESQRGDQLDALLQALHDRWHNRGDTRPGSSRIVLNDIEKSIAAVETAFETMQQLHTARNMTAGQWKSRRLALEKSLLLPLRAYRSSLMLHHAKR